MSTVTRKQRTHTAQVVACMDGAGVGAVGADMGGVDVVVGRASVPKVSVSYLLFSSSIFFF